MSDSWKDFVEAIKGYGFEIIVQRRFERSIPGWKTDYPEFLIAAHRQKFLLLSAVSYVGYPNREIINSGRVYGNLEASGDLTPDQEQAVEGASRGFADFGFEFSYDVRHDPIGFLNRLEKVFKFAKWNNPNRFLWLIDDSQNPDSWKEARDEFLAGAPEWIRDFILPDKEHALILKKKATARKRTSRN